LNGYEKDHLVRCAACRMVFALRRPTEAELQATYGSYPLIPELNPITRQRFLALLDRLEPMRRTGRLLDAGSGSGYFLDTAMERGWEAHGTEYDPAVVEACRKRGIRMQQGLLDPANYEPGSFDAVTSFEVLEHLVEPLRELQHFAALLRPGGQLYLTTPNFNSVSRRLTGAAWNIIAYPEHLNYFTPRTLARALRTAGFARIRIATTGISPMRLRNSVAGATVQANADPTNDDQVLRQRIERNPLLGLAKHGVNAALTLLGAGDTIKVFARKAQ
jgi:2-polyprenyl-3-methyl-5-hydroxy-6-metoxy-1,4-benzoquinol methylase